MNLQGTKSEKNLHNALVGESLARNKYSFYAMAAKSAGLTQVSNDLERMAQNEMMHAKLWFKLLYGEHETTENLKEAARGEFSEWHSMYPGFAAQAREEGLEELAVMFEQVASIEKDHERQFMTLVAHLSAGAPKPKEQVKHIEGWRCQFCGALFEQKPDTCNTCQAIGAFDHVTWEERD